MRLVKTALLAALLLQPLTAAAETAPPRITVTGEGRVETRPDMATVNLGVTTEAPTAAEAMAANSDELARVLERLRAAGIAERDLQTSSLSLNPNWHHAAGAEQPRITGYIASNQLMVRVRDLTALGGVLDAAVKDGANTLNGVTFGLTDPEPMLAEARRKAVADARARAELLAEAAGVALGPIDSITEAGAMNGPQPMYRGAAVAMESSMPVAEGELSIAANVTVVWQISQ
ncbi:SIMPL domain-containing protein [Szabonella alba]|uniref:SIMPL domain-containing protein n=1 Tax=Szabonella alba TaxID=2804194 RepID=A0A8K0XZ11_9RHOB|nr:SIMPL domain-containing protein [Szabonella alba]MBL4916306.1 SIMPL domain-containing protein [Szabonella alba]